MVFGHHLKLFLAGVPPQALLGSLQINVEAKKGNLQKEMPLKGSVFFVLF